MKCIPHGGTAKCAVALFEGHDPTGGFLLPHFFREALFDTGLPNIDRLWYLVSDLEERRGNREESCSMPNEKLSFWAKLTKIVVPSMVIAGCAFGAWAILQYKDIADRRVELANGMVAIAKERGDIKAEKANILTEKAKLETKKLEVAGERTELRYNKSQVCESYKQSKSCKPCEPCKQCKPCEPCKPCKPCMDPDSVKIQVSGLKSRQKLPFDKQKENIKRLIRELFKATNDPKMCLGDLFLPGNPTGSFLPITMYQPAAAVNALQDEGFLKIYDPGEGCFTYLP